jgi:hypothetical protein
MIIGLGYKARAGKDTVGTILRDHFGFKTAAFADSLKEAARTIFNLNDYQLYGPGKGEVDPFWEDTPRNILQRMGTECMRRGYRDDIWIKCVERRIADDPERSWVITDVRFPNEAEAVKGWGGYVVRVDRPLAERLIGKEASKHASEVSMSFYQGWDHVLSNNGTVEELAKQVSQMLKKFQGG